MLSGSPSIAAEVTKIIRAYLDGNMPYGVASVREVGLAMFGNNALGPGCEIILANGSRFHVAVIEQPQTRRPIEFHDP